MTTGLRVSKAKDTGSLLNISLGVPDYNSSSHRRIGPKVWRERYQIVATISLYIKVMIKALRIAALGYRCWILQM